MYACRRCTIAGNNASFCSGWGIHLNDSSKNVIRDNVADWCNRIYVRPDGSYHAGADAAALLLVVNSNRNLVERNMFRGGGDGVFLAGYKHPDIIAPCNDNVFRGNDCSLSPNNAFEATFSTGNVFAGNQANASNFGFWLGYSTRNVVEDNDINDNRYAGIAIEHGRENRILANRMARNRVGVRLWSDPDEDFITVFPQLARSENNVVSNNEINGGRVGVAVRTDRAMEHPMCSGDRIVGNRIIDNRIGVRYARGRDTTIRANRITGQVETGMELQDVAGFIVCDNYFDNSVNAKAQRDITWSCPAQKNGASRNIVGGDRFGGNFWSDYAGADVDGDLIGDTHLPYLPVGVTGGGDSQPLVRPES
jgi:parallel beta-helix repeat protein